MDRFPQTSWDPLRPDITDLLHASPVTDCDLIRSASNYVFLVALQDHNAGLGYAVYKPARGESPLWDFPPDIYRREVASFLVSDALGWELVPPTVEREAGLAHGAGSLQAFIPSDRGSTYFDLRVDHADAMRRLATFDWLTNNADRKGGHVMLGEDGTIWGIDNALSFHVEDKLRTVIWDYIGEPVPPPLLTDVEAFLTRMQPESALWASLSAYLEAEECKALRDRAEQILKSRVFPQPPEWRRPYPWPLI